MLRTGVRVNAPVLCVHFPSKVKQSIMMMETLCQKLQRTHFLKGSGGMRGPMVKK